MEEDEQARRIADDPGALVGRQYATVCYVLFRVLHWLCAVGVTGRRLQQQQQQQEATLRERLLLGLRRGLKRVRDSAVRRRGRAASMRPQWPALQVLGARHWPQDALACLLHDGCRHILVMPSLYASRLSLRSENTRLGRKLSTSPPAQRQGPAQAR